MALWTSDLTTEDAAAGATSAAGLACFIMAGFCVLGAAFLVSATIGTPPVTAAAMLTSAVAELTLFLIAGFRFRSGKGLAWGSVAALILVLEIAMKLVMLAIPGLIINGVALVVIINGIRGAAAMRRGFTDYQEQAEIFG